MDMLQVKKPMGFLYQRTQAPLLLVTNNQAAYFPTYNPILNMLETFEYLFVMDEYPIHIVNTYELLAASFTLEIEGQTYWLLIGPCVIMGNTDHLQANNKDSYLKSLTSLESLNSFHELVKYVYTIYTQRPCNNLKIPIKYKRSSVLSAQPRKRYEDDLYQRRIENATRDSYQIELRFVDYVKKGRRNKINWLFDATSKTYIVHLADNSFDSIRYKFVSLVTLLTRCAIDCGVTLDSAFSLSDSLIKGLSNMKNEKDVLEYLKYACYEFIDLIHPNQNTNYSAKINQCINYIDSNLYNKITLDELAALTSLSNVYLSSLFKKEVHMTISEYIVTLKIEEAKNLLLFTDYSIQEISTLLNFTSQSHFTKRFKEFTNQTPKAFRDMNFQYL